MDAAAARSDPVQEILPLSHRRESTATSSSGPTRAGSARSRRWQGLDPDVNCAARDRRGIESGGARGPGPRRQRRRGALRSRRSPAGVPRSSTMTPGARPSTAARARCRPSSSAHESSSRPPTEPPGPLPSGKSTAAPRPFSSAIPVDLASATGGRFHVGNLSKSRGDKR